MHLTKRPSGDLPRRSPGLSAGGTAPPDDRLLVRPKGRANQRMDADPLRGPVIRRARYATKRFKEMSKLAGGKEFMTFRTKKALVISLLSIGLLCFIVKLILFFYLQGISTQTPNIATGKIYPLNNHGYIFHVTRLQSLLQDILFAAFFIFAFGAAILELRWKTIRNLFDEMPKKPY